MLNLKRITKAMNTNHIKTLALVLLSSAVMMSCSDAIDGAGVNEEQYQAPQTNLAFLTDKYGLSNQDSLLFNESGSTDFYVNLVEPVTGDQTFTVAYDVTALKNYNTAHGTQYEALPEELVTVSGKATVAAGNIKSAPVAVSYKTADHLTKNGVYAIPLKVSGSGAETSLEKGEFVLFVRDITKMPNCHKDNGLQVISCMEINDANPLYNLCFTLEKSGKYFFDQVILFSGNINYNPETQEVYNYNNENISHVLNFKEKYLEPLQEKGMKVILGILGNHDRSAVTNLNDEACIAFAADLKAKVEAYDLDGVFFDDEYSSPGDYPGFVVGENNFARLAYECKKAMPDKLIEAYVYSGTSSCEKVEGIQPIDYGIHDYGGSYDLSSSYPGMDKKGMILNSMEFARGRSSTEAAFERIKQEGYGGTMIFALAPHTLRLEWMNRVARAFYGEEVVVTGSYSKDW
jgi:hypothetical protein